MFSVLPTCGVEEKTYTAFNSWTVSDIRRTHGQKMSRKNAQIGSTGFPHTSQEQQSADRRPLPVLTKHQKTHTTHGPTTAVDASQ